MKKTLTLSKILAVGLVLLAAGPARAQQIAALAPRSDAPRLEAKHVGRPSPEEQRVRIANLQKRKGALEKYLASVSPASADYEATERSIRELDAKLRDLAAEALAAARPVPVRGVPAQLKEAADDAAGSGLISISAGEQRTPFKSEIKIKVSPAFSSNIKIAVFNKNREEIFSKTLTSLMRGVNDYTTTVDLREGINYVMASSTDDANVSNALVLSGGREALQESENAAAAREEAPPPLDCHKAPAAADAERYNELCKGGALVGLLVGGVVVSQQAENFSQADPFMGFIAGYSHKGPRQRLHWRVQGIFQTQAKAEEAPEETDEEEEPVDATDFKPFLASRKSFDVDMHGWIDVPFPGMFGEGPNPSVRVGIYAAAGGTTYLDKNELKGDESVKVEADDAATEDGDTENDQVELDTDLAKIDNDINLFYEGGLIGNFFTDGGKSNEKLFMQAILAYGNYEGLAGLYANHNTRHRFIGKLRIFPKFLDFTAAGGASMSPMFGVEISAGRGPDQIKFFTGIASAIRLFKTVTR